MTEQKITQSACHFDYCHYNPIPPSEGSQECIACEGLDSENKEKEPVSP